MYVNIYISVSDRKGKKQLIKHGHIKKNSLWNLRQGWSLVRCPHQVSAVTTVREGGTQGPPPHYSQRGPQVTHHQHTGIKEIPHHDQWSLCLGQVVSPAAPGIVSAATVTSPDADFWTMKLRELQLM